MSLTGDPATDAMVAPAMDLVWAVRKNDGVSITNVFREAALHTDGDLYRAAAGLAVVLAAMVPDDRAAEDLLYWAAADRDRYLELRYAGMGSVDAAVEATPKPQGPDSLGCVVPIRRGR